ncbi:MAG: hypothetical protein OXC82_06330, partial [Rhodobacteraceae bacterium]|nr:hypothetical protein [Paracoccaceae bacterium]
DGGKRNGISTIVNYDSNSKEVQKIIDLRIAYENDHDSCVGIVWCCLWRCIISGIVNAGGISMS